MATTTTIASISFTPEELSETVFIAAALRAGGAVTHGTHLVE